MQEIEPPTLKMTVIWTQKSHLTDHYNLTSHLSYTKLVDEKGDKQFFEMKSSKLLYHLPCIQISKQQFLCKCKCNVTYCNYPLLLSHGRWLNPREELWFGQGADPAHPCIAENGWHQSHHRDKTAILNNVYYDNYCVITSPCMTKCHDKMSQGMQC